MAERIVNTTNEESRHEWVMGGAPGSIEAQEARGQRQLVSSQQLPVNIRPDDGKATLEAAGVVFGEPTEGDPIFCEATLPEGWSKQPTDHSMWAKLVDADGREWASIFYKAAFYDRSAHMMVNPPAESAT